jgi:hypothetical protein
LNDEEVIYEVDKQKVFSLIHYTPHPKQQRIHDSQARYRIASCGVRFGKSWSAAAEAVSMLFYKDVRGWIVAPTLDLSEKVFREVYRYAVEYCRPYIAEESYSRKYIKFITGSELQCKTAENLVSLSGEALDFIIIDEAPAIKEEAWTHFLRERITDRKGWVLLIGTPVGRNWYYRMFLKGQEGAGEYESWNFTTYDNPYVDKEEIDKAKGELPERAFNQQYLAHFISEAGSVFKNIRELISDTLSEPIKDRHYVGGLDVAKYQDYTVLTIFDSSTNNLVYFDRWNKTDWSYTYDRANNAVRRYNNALVYIDSTGVGDAVYEALTKPPYNMNVKPFNFGGGRKTNLIDNLAWNMDNRKIHYPDIPELINELELFEYEISETTGRTSFSSPSGYHDDIVCSLALGAWGLSRDTEIMTVGNLGDFFRRKPT